MNDTQVDLISAGLADADGVDFDGLESEQQERYRERARAAAARLNARKGRAVNHEQMNRRRLVMLHAFVNGKSMANALREAEPDLSPSYIGTLMREVYAWDLGQGHLLHGVGAWSRKENADIRYEVSVETREGKSLRRRFADLTDAEAWLRDLDEEWNA